MAEFQKGDVAKLKSGGPTMTIEGIETYDSQEKAKCTWFDGETEKSQIFLLEALEKL